jgi:hypothetical protein
VEELTENVKLLVKNANEEASANMNMDLLVHRRVRHKFVEEGIEQWYHGKVVSQVMKSSVEMKTFVQVDYYLIFMHPVLVIFVF